MSALVFLSRAIWISRLWVIGITVSIALLSIIFSLLTPVVYRASSTITAADGVSGSTGGLGALASQFGIDQLADVALPNSSLNEAITVLQSRALTEHFFKKYNVLPQLYYDRWDAEKKQWRAPSPLEQLISRNDGTVKDGDLTPSAWSAFRKFDRIRTVLIDRKNSTVTVSVDWRDPVVAAQWVNELVQDTDDILRQRTLVETQRSITFLESKAAESSLADLHQSIYSVAAQELKRNMLANVRSNFALKVLDPAVVPGERSWPRRTFIVVVSTIVGFFVACLFALARVYFNEVRVHFRAAE